MQVRLVRSSDDRVVAGVCAGIAGQIGVDPVVVRLVIALLTVVNGLGLAVYAAAWALMPEQDGPATPPARRLTPERAVAVAMIALGTMLLFRELRLSLPDRVVIPASLAAVGAGLVWARGSDADRERWSGFVRGLPTGTTGTGAVVLRAVVGGSLLIVALVAVLGSSSALEAIGRVGIAVAATALGVGLILAPWIVRLWRDLATERRERIRSEERAEVAAHLHDSVLQTLALIQRHADSPAQARTLARAQERELRSWLYGQRRSDPSTLAAAIDTIAADVERRHDVAVDAVVVGDCPVDTRVDALLGAVREATVNAARHAGAAEVSIYVEVEPELVSAYVRDRGRGFDPDAVPAGRLGLAESVVGRMARHGGAAEVHSTPGDGTEIALELPR